MPTDPVSAYLSYLQQMARKVAYRGTTVDVLGGRSRRQNARYLDYDSLIDDADLQRYLTGVADDRQLNESRTLFIGVGLIVGTTELSGKTVSVSAPLMMIPCELELPDETDSTHGFTPDWSDACLNYDLISKILDKSEAVDSDDALGIPDFIAPAVTVAMRKIEEKLRDASAAPNAEQQLCDPRFASEIAGILRSEIPAFRSIKDASTKYRQTDKKHDGLLWHNHRFYFVATMPDSLSAYRALIRLRAEFETRPNHTPTGPLRPLLAGLLQGLPVNFRSRDPDTTTLVKDLLPKVPLSLSARQQQAVMNAISSELSYIQGPPGTGKSHTIAATMITALLLKKRVLLTSHKKAAIDVVRSKLRQVLGSHNFEEAAIYVGDDSAERARMRKRINDLLAKVQSVDYEAHLANARTQENRTRSELEETLQQIQQMRAILRKALERTNDEFKSTQDHLRLRRGYYDVFGEGDLEPDRLGSVGKICDDWDRIVGNVTEIQTRKSAGENVTAGEILGTRMALANYATRFSAGWISTRPWDAHRLRSHYQAIRAHDMARKAAEGITIDLNQVRRTLDIASASAMEKAQKYLRALYTHEQLRNAHESQRDLSHFASLFWLRKPRLVRERMEDIDYSRLTRVFPLWLGEIGHLGAMLPFRPRIFDLAIVDESSQVNIAETVPVFYRAGSYCVVGDRAQLGLGAAGLFGLNRTFEELAWKQAFHDIPRAISYAAARERQLVVSSSSILDFIVSPTNGLNVPKVTLNEHFRSMPSLAAFTSETFYESDGGLQVMTEVGTNLGKECFKLIETGGDRADDGKLVPREIDATLQIIGDIINGRELGNGSPLRNLGFIHPGNLPSVGVVCFTTDQRDAIRNQVEERIRRGDCESVNLLVGTPEEFQGNERDVVILTFGLGQNSSRFASAHYENPNRFNVATSRARKFTYAVIGQCPPSARLLRRYFSHFGFQPTILKTTACEESSATSENIKLNPSSALTWSFDERLCESEFEHVVLSSLYEFKKANPTRQLDIFNQVTTCGQKRIDFVLFDRRSRQSAAIEVDGQDHFCADGVTYHDAHLERAAVLRRAGWKLVHVPHHLWYQNGWIHRRNTDEFACVEMDFHSSLRRALGY